VKRGETWWADVDKRRPVLLVSRDEAYLRRELIVVVGVTTTIRGYAVEVKLGAAEGMPRACVANCDWLLTIPRRRLIERAGALSASKIEQLDDALAFALGLL
jgi:mRNA interferase MazF